MAGVGGLSSLAVFLILLLASFSAAREERSTRAWTDVTALTEFNFLALLEYSQGGASAFCSGSIISPSMILTYCTGNATMAYAGLLKVAEKAKAKQQGEVAKVVPHSSDLSALKICILKEEWQLTDEVGVVKIPPNTQRENIEDCTLLGFGKDDGVARKLLTQTIGPQLCSVTHTAGELYSLLPKADKATLKLNDADLGGPAVCGGAQRGINKQYIAGEENADGCNVFVDVAKYSPWIEAQKNPADSGASGGTGGNGTSPSSGYSIHRNLNKYSNWKVLVFLVPTIVTFLQY